MKKFKIIIPTLDSDGYLPDCYGGNAPVETLINGLSYLSPEISWEAVENAKSYALEFIDYDSASACGLIFVHWVVANIPTTKLEINASLTNKHILQGINSCTQGIYKNFELNDDQKRISNLENSVYVGPCPPNSDHTYTFKVYALDVEKVQLKQPFFIGEFHLAIDSHIIAESSINLKYRHVKNRK